MKGYDERDRLGALRNSIERNKQIPDYIKKLKLIILNKISTFAINIANNAVGNVELAYWREHSDFKEQVEEIERLRETSGCLYAEKGRGDCKHFVGLPGKSISGQHDGKDDTVDAYGKPNGWCWSCWKSYQIERLREEKEWLINECVRQYVRGVYKPNIENAKEWMIAKMQQALKEKKK